MKSGTGRGNLGEVWDGSGDPRKGPGRVVGTTGRSETGLGTLGVVRETLEEFRGTLGKVRGPLGKERRTLREVLGTLGEVRGPSRRSERLSGRSR